MTYRVVTMKGISIQVVLAVLLGSVLSGCMTFLQPFDTPPAQPGLQSAVYDDLTSLPPPSEKVVVAVYRFRDQTGQYKLSDRAASWSTAVTQGATSILMRALEESDWFIPIEREGLSNLLNERQIIQSIRAQHTGPNGEPLGPLPPLLYAGVLLEGGIIGYDTNVITSGAGARYFGTGGSGQMRQDQVTVYLRIVSTQNGRVLKTVHTTKTIVSQQVDGGLFRYVDVNRILEGEAGYSLNEPPVLAVTEAIEEAVKNLVVEGVRENLWSLKNPADVESELFAAYDASREQADRMDYFGRTMQQQNRPGLGIGARVNALRYQGDYRDPLVQPGGEAFLRFNVSPHLGLSVSGSVGSLAADRAFDASFVAGDVQLLYYLVPDGRLTPFLAAGGGAMLRKQSATLTAEDEVFPYLSAALGLEYMATRRFGLSVSVGNDYPLVEGLDGYENGRIHDNVWGVKTGLTYYLF